MINLYFMHCLLTSPEDAVENLGRSPRLLKQVPRDPANVSTITIPFNCYYWIKSTLMQQKKMFENYHFPCPEDPKVVFDNEAGANKR